MNRRYFLSLLGLTGCCDLDIKPKKEMSAEWFNALMGSVNPYPACDFGDYDVHAQFIIDTMTSLGATVDDTRKGYINTLVDGLKSDGEWDELSCLQMYNSPTDASSLFNWINPNCFIPTKSGTLTFAANSGYTGNGTNGYINTNYLDARSELAALNSQTLFAWTFTNNAETKALFGTNPTAGGYASQLYPRDASNFAQASLNNAFPPISTTAGTISDSSGFWAIQRTNSTQFSLYRNASLVETFSKNSVSRTNSRFFVLAQNNNGTAVNFSTRKVTLFGAGSGNVDLSALYSRLSTYLTSIGAI